MLPTPPQPDNAAAAGGGEKEEFGDPTKFHNWAGRGAADILINQIPSVTTAPDDRVEDMQLCIIS